MYVMHIVKQVPLATRANTVVATVVFSSGNCTAGRLVSKLLKVMHQLVTIKL